MAVNYNDKRFTQVKNEEQKALQNANNTYNTMINNSDKYYNDMIQAADDYGKTQSEIQQANTDFAIEKIEQQKDQAAKDYTREQKGAYSDWQKQSDQYGVNAERIASMGLAGSGYSESSQVSMYNTYQNRISQARDTYSRAVLEYDNGIKEAQLTNNAKLAEIAYQSLQNKLELGLNQFQYKNNLLTQQLQLQNDISDRYYKRWSDVLSQINTENALAEQQRQFNANLAEEKRQYNETMALQKKNLSSSGGRSSGGGTYRLSGSSGGSSARSLSDKSSSGNSNNKSSLRSKYSASQQAINGKQNNTNTVKSVNRPSGLTKKGNNWISKNITKKSYTTKELQSLLNKGQKGGYLTQDDILMVMSQFGLQPTKSNAKSFSISYNENYKR